MNIIVSWWYRLGERRQFYLATAVMLFLTLTGSVTAAVASKFRMEIEQWFTAHVR